MTRERNDDGYLVAGMVLATILAVAVSWHDTPVAQPQSSSDAAVSAELQDLNRKIDELKELQRALPARPPPEPQSGGMTMLQNGGLIQNQGGSTTFWMGTASSASWSGMTASAASSGYVIFNSYGGVGGGGSAQVSAPINGGAGSITCSFSGASAMSSCTTATVTPPQPRMTCNAGDKNLTLDGGYVLKPTECFAYASPHDTKIEISMQTSPNHHYSTLPTCPADGDQLKSCEEARTYDGDAGHGFQRCVANGLLCARQW